MGDVYSVCRASPVSGVSQNNQVNIILIPKWHILEWCTLVSYNHILGGIFWSPTVSQDENQEHDR